MQKRMRTIFISVLTLILFGQSLDRSAAISGLKQTRSDGSNAELEAFEQFVIEQMKQDRIPGMTIGFFKGEFTWVKGFGYADVENRTPAHRDSAYRIASTTKTMTGAAIVLLAEQGKLNLDAEIQTYVPEYPRQQWPVTVRQLLTHLGGGQGPSGLGPEQVSMKELVERLSKNPITIEPGTRFVYGTGAYNLLAAAIENLTGGSFEKYLRENLWLPAGMKDTRIDDVRSIVPNRVRGYDLADGDLKNAPFINLSSRIGGGGVTSTIPDLLRWARAITEKKVLSEKWHHEMLEPVTKRSGRWSGIGDADEYYTLGWMVRPVNGNFVINHGGSQKGTDCAFFIFPARQIAIAIASNLEFAPLSKYVEQLYETITGEEWTVRVFTRDAADAPIARALDNTYNYGSLYYWQHNSPFVTDTHELSKAFSYFNRNASQEVMRNDKSSVMRIRDGRHPIGGNAFIKVGSFMAAKLLEKNGPASFKKYYVAGAIPFFADYIRLYRESNYSPDLRFSPAFETLIERWNEDWTRTWNTYTRGVVLTAHSNLALIRERLLREFSGADVYPDFTNELQRIQQGDAALWASKLGIDLYPYSDELLFNWAYFLIIAEQTETGRVAARHIGGTYDRPLSYFRRAFEANPQGVMAAGTFVDLGRRWLRRPEMIRAANEFVMAGVALHPKEALLHELLGDILVRQGQVERAAASYRTAFQLNPKIGKGASLDEYLSERTKP